MKNIKKISALLAAAMISAGTVSSMSAGAIIEWDHWDKLQELFDDAPRIAYNDSDWHDFSRVYEKYCSDMFVIGADDHYAYYEFHSAKTNYISASVDADIDADALYQGILEIVPDAEWIAISDPVGMTGPEFRTISVALRSIRERYRYDELKEKDMTNEQAEALYELISSTCKIRKFTFHLKDLVTLSTSGGFLTEYEPEYDGVNNLEVIENYIKENELPYHIDLNPYKMKEDDYQKYGSTFAVLPDENDTTAERLELATQIRKELNISPCLIFPCSADSVELSEIEMHTNIKGDANDDGELRLSDAITILQALGNPDEYELTAQGRYNADISGDRDGITAMDAVAVQKKILGLE